MNIEHQGRILVRANETAANARGKIERATHGIIGRALAQMLSPDGLRRGPEREFFDDTARKAPIAEIQRISYAGVLESHFRFPKAGDSQGIFVPWDVLGRAMSTTSGPKGGFAAGAEVLDPVDVLRPFSVTGRLPVQSVQLGGQGSIPLTNTPITVTWQGGDGVSVTAADAALGSGSLTPRTALALTQFSRQLEVQSPNYYDFLARLMMRAAGSALDKALLNGAGGAEPLGILNLPTLSKVTGTSLPWSGNDSALRMRRTVADAGADDEGVAWIGTPTVRETLSAREVVADTGRFVWTNGQVDGRPAYATTDLPAGALLLGDFSRVLTGFWGGGIVVEVDPNNDFNKGLAAMRVVMICDVCPLSVAAFSAAENVT